MAGVQTCLHPPARVALSTASKSATLSWPRGRPPTGRQVRAHASAQLTCRNHPQPTPERKVERREGNHEGQTSQQGNAYANLYRKEMAPSGRPNDKKGSGKTTTKTRQANMVVSTPPPTVRRHPAPGPKQPKTEPEQQEDSHAVTRTQPLVPKITIWQCRPTTHSCKRAVSQPHHEVVQLQINVRGRRSQP